MNKYLYFKESYNDVLCKVLLKLKIYKPKLKNVCVESVSFDGNNLIVNYSHLLEGDHKEIKRIMISEREMNIENMDDFQKELEENIRIYQEIDSLN